MGLSLLDVGDQVGCFHFGDAHGGHAHGRKLGRERQSDGVFLPAHLLGICDEAREPCHLPALADAGEVGPYPITAPDAVAAGAGLGEHGVHALSLGGHGRGLRDVARRFSGGGAPIRFHGADGHRQPRQITEWIVALPFAGHTIAEQNLVAVFVQRAAAIAKPVADELDIFGHAGQEQPPWACPHGFCVFFKTFGRVVFRVNADGIKEDLAPDAVAK